MLQRRQLGPMEKLHFKKRGYTDKKRNFLDQKIFRKAKKGDNG